MALFLSLLCHAASSANLNRKFLARGISNKLAGLLLHILGGTRGLVHSPALLRTLAIANLLQRSVTLLDCLVEGLLLEGDGAELLSVLVGALQDRLLLQGSHGLLLVHAAQPSVGV